MRRLALATTLVALSSTASVRSDDRAARTPRLRGAATAHAEHVPKRSRADTLRGSFTTPGRNWWDVTFYDLHVAHPA